jgi:periplasmic protein TonB
MNTQQLLKADLLDILFDGKNKTYGAYQIRKGYYNRMLIALGISFAAVFVISAVLFYWPKKNLTSGNFNPEIEMCTLNINPKEIKNKLVLPQPKSPIIKPVSPPNTYKNIPPIITPDMYVPLPPNDNNKDGQISNSDNNNGANNGQLIPNLLPLNNGGSMEGNNIVPPIITPPILKTPFTENLSFKTVKPAGWDNYLQRALQPYADKATDNGCEDGKYRIVISFLVDETGKPSEANIIEGGDKCNLGTYAKQILMKGPNWPINRNSSGDATKSIQQTSFVIQIGETE